ncbi:MAG: TlpA disulfide reductase family protein [Polyangiales bacterium]
MRAIVLLGVLASVAGCSSASSATSGGTEDCQAGAAAYPPGLCGYNPGQTIADLVFQGKTGGTSATTQTVKLSDWYDPKATAPNKLLLLDVSGLWCQACKSEAAAMSQLESDYASKGVFFVTVVAENDSNQPASATDVDAWITSYSLTSLVVNDPTLTTEQYFDRSQMPLNMIIELRTMTIAAKLVGYVDSEIRAKLDAELGN